MYYLPIYYYTMHYYCMLTMVYCGIIVTTTTGLRESLYAQRTKLPYRLTGCQLNASPLYLAPSR